MTATATTVLGRTGLTVSRMALGGYDALGRRGFERAVELGINFFISFPGYEREQRAIGKAVRGMPRDKLVLAAGAAGRSASSVRRDLTRSLTALRTDYVDVFYLYHVTCDAWPKILARGGAMEELDRARRSGRVRHVGVTVHNRDLAVRIIEDGRVDVMNLRYSLAHPGHEEKVFPAARARDCGVVAYSALKYGLLIRDHDGLPARTRIPTPAECYRFLLSHPAVHVAWVGARTIEEVEQNLRVVRPFRRLPRPMERRLRSFGAFVHDALPAQPKRSRRSHR